MNAFRVPIYLTLSWVIYKQYIFCNLHSNSVKFSLANKINIDPNKIAYSFCVLLKRFM